MLVTFFASLFGLVVVCGEGSSSVFLFILQYNYSIALQQGGIKKPCEMGVNYNYYIIITRGYLSKLLRIPHFFFFFYQYLYQY